MDELRRGRRSEGLSRTDRQALSRSRRQGFSLIEVMLAMTILGIGMLSLGAMQLLALEYGNRGRHGTQASIIAETEIERLQRLDWDDPDLDPTGNWTAVVTRNHNVQVGGGASVEQAYDLSWRVTDVVAGSTKSVDVRVQWDEPNRPTRTYALSTIRYDF